MSSDLLNNHQQTMPFATLHRALVERLEEGDGGGHGWWLVTRVHLSTGRLKAMARYLFDAGATDWLNLEARHYQDLATLIGSNAADPGIGLRRHHLLAMDTPLNLIQRNPPGSWDAVRLTEMGKALAEKDDSNVVLDQALQRIVFCREPYFTESRVGQYGDFEVEPYQVTMEVLQKCDGWIDRDEYDLFLSRVRTAREIPWAIRNIVAFRELADHEKRLLLKEVEKRFDSPKTYQNWRDMALHTFSFLALGISLVRSGQTLVLTSEAVEIRQRTGTPRRPGRREAVLRIPSPPPNQELATPPVGRDANGGTEAELLVAKLLEGSGWQVVFYTNKRGFGFDLWAKRQESVMLVEVKSSFQRVGAIALTRLEYAAARQYQENFYLAIVENLATEATIRFVQNPARLRIHEETTVDYVLRREAWDQAAGDLQG